MKTKGSHAADPLMELMKLLRRIIVLAVAAYGLAREMPYPVLGFRLLLLWAVLYICSGIIDIIYRHLHHKAEIRRSRESEVSTPHAPTNPQERNLPAVTAGRSG